MSRGNWNKIKQSKFFYVKIYRKLLSAIIASLLINIILCAGIIYSHLHKPLRAYYATNGVTPPVQLSARSVPNYSEVYLLPPDPVNENDNKVIPD